MIEGLRQCVVSKIHYHASYRIIWNFFTSVTDSTKESIPLVVAHHRVVEDKVVHHKGQRCFYNKDLDMGMLQVPSTAKPKCKSFKCVNISKC